jgi:hypothetical protein
MCRIEQQVPRHRHLPASWPHPSPPFTLWAERAGGSRHGITSSSQIVGFASVPPRTEHTEPPHRVSAETPSAPIQQMAPVSTPIHRPRRASEEDPCPRRPAPRRFDQGSPPSPPAPTAGRWPGSTGADTGASVARATSAHTTRRPSTRVGRSREAYIRSHIHRPESSRRTTARARRAYSRLVPRAPGRYGRFAR